jgi:SAM-dependent methyltransferase
MGSTYVLADADDDRELTRLRHLEAVADPLTIQRLNATAVGPGWRCLEIGAGAGSIARWLGEAVGPSGSVVACDINPRYLSGARPNVEVRRHDVTQDDLEPEAYDLVHARALLQHLPDPLACLARMVAAVAPGGWLVVEEGDFGTLDLAGPADAAKATAVFQDAMSRMTAASIMHANFGRSVPGLVYALEWERFGADSRTVIARPDEPAYESVRLAWPGARRAALALGLDEADLKCVDDVLESSTTLMVHVTMFGAWARKRRGG